MEEEAGNKALEAESHYRSCVDESNSRHRNLLAVKSQVRERERERESWRGSLTDVLLCSGAAADQGVVDAG